jgi:5-methyltetrahydropteroyltriglutamate--homocysteine methyltransferase
MLRSDGRILTTHTGSLPRPVALTQMFLALSKRDEVDHEALHKQVAAATLDVIRKQRAAGIDVGNDGEQARESFFTYVQHRLSGYGGESDRPLMRDMTAFPTFVALKWPEYNQRPSVTLIRAPKAIAEVKHVSMDPIREECDELARLLEAEGKPFAETLMTAASPGIIAAGMLNDFYPTEDEYVLAVADAMRPEYEHILSRGFLLQLDCPDLAMERHSSYADRSLDDFKAYVRRNISTINRAIEGMPADRIRLHACWGNYEGPHHLDVPLEEILPLLYEANVGALVLPFANPRHAHEWRALEKHPPPHNWLIVAGVIDTTTNYVEHPQVVADRIECVAMAVGDPRRVLAGTDCGFGTAAGFGEVAEEVVWLKMRSLVEGAELASKRLFA